MGEKLIHSYIPTLNGWRAFSILYVLIFHGTWIYVNPDTGLYPDEKWWTISKNGAFGVYFFFGISGYLITARLIEELKAKGTVSLSAFYWRRFFRIVPILLAFLAVLIVLKSFNLIELSTMEIWSSLFFFRNYIADNQSGWFAGHFWSLSMEEHYYLLWPTLFICFMKMKRPWIPIALILILVTGWRMIEYRYRILAPYLPTSHFRGRTDLFFDYMMWGSLAAVLNSTEKFKLFFYRYTRDWMVYLPLLLIHLMFFIQIPSHDLVKGVAIQACLLLSINFPHSSFSRFLERKWLATIGLYSYSLYVWQQLILTPADQRIKGLEWIQTPPINIVLLILLAYLSYNWLEIPAINFGKKFLKNKQKESHS